MTLMRPRYSIPMMPTLREAIDRLFDESFVRPGEWLTLGMEGKIAPSLDAYATKDSFVVRAALPGVKPDAVETTIDGDTLTIRGTYEEKGEKEEAGYLLRELSRGEFRRNLVLPTGLKTDAVEAVFEHGILTLTFPKAESAKPRRITVTAR
ncbi:MAG TPA: Hsp20/alpha crystallin family protein [Candidatus Limnocylindria bacterium]|nr:Hsp20/alpha crystallin family protein [Candidatus Limnocylindria bacterium]